MAVIPPRDLNAAASVSDTDVLIVDKGSSVEKALPSQIIDAAIPLASQAEAEAGSDNVKRVTPLRVKQAIDAIGISADSLAAGLATKVSTADLSSPDEGKGAELVDFSHPAPQAAKGFPAYNFRTQRRNLADFIEKDQWAAIRNGTATATATNGYGVDAYSAALSDMAGAVGGEIEVPDGLFILPQILASQTNLTLRGRGSSTTIKTTSATEHQIDVRVPFVTIADMVFTSSVPRTAGACIRVSNDAPRFVCEGVTSYNAFTLLQIDGHPTDPSLDSGIFNASRLRAYNSVQNGYPYRIGGGYVVTLDDVHAIGDPDVSALSGPAAGLYVTRCADLRVQGNSQFLNCQRSIDVMPATGSTVASFKMEGGYCGTSFYGSRLSCANG